MPQSTSHYIRCFIAVPLPPDIRDRIDRYLVDLKRINQSVKWVRAENIHLTLKFFGEIGTEKVEEIKKVLPAISTISSPFMLDISGSGCFPNIRKPRVFWLGIGRNGLNKLETLYRWLEDNMFRLGFEKEGRRFSPHLTLGRVKKEADFSTLLEHLEKRPFPATAFEINRIELIKSELHPQGARYTTLTGAAL